MIAQNDKRIFIVDDDPFWIELLSQILKSLGFENIISFNNGTDCVQNLHLNPSVVFLDYQMDDINGLDVLQQIKSYYPGIGVVFCTAHEDLSIAVSAIKYGSFDYMLKTNANKKEITNIIKQLNDNLLTDSKSA